MGGVGCFVYDGESEAEDDIIHQHPLSGILAEQALI